MNLDPLRVLASHALHGVLRAALVGSDWGPFEVIGLASEQVPQADGCAALVLDEADAQRWSTMGLHLDAPLLVVADRVTPHAALDWLRRGAQDVLTPDDLDDAAIGFRLRAAVERERHAGEARTAYATDMATGLPHQQQLIEHMSHLMALREREPAPMALLVLRVEGLATTAARLGRESAQVLRRKLAVRLRAGVRASDVVAALADDSFAVLLASLLAPADAQRVGAKLLSALQVPFKIAGTDVAVAAALGIAIHPEHGAQPAELLQRAAALAAGTPAQGRTGLTNFHESGGRSPDAANDD